MTDAPALPPGVAPLFLTLEQAAAYAGVSTDTFRAEVEAGLWPGPVRRGAKATKQTWHREAMEEAARRMAGAALPPKMPDPLPVPANQPGLTAGDLELVERMRRAKAADRTERRNPQAA